MVSQQMAVRTTVHYEDHAVLVNVYDPDEHIQKRWFAGKFYESRRGQLLRYMSTRFEGGVYVDVGANLGNHTLFFLEVLGADHVFAIEPVREWYDRMRENLDLNGVSHKVTPLNVAMGDHYGEVSMVPLSDKNNCGNWGVDEQGEGVMLAPLDKVLSDVEAVTAIKIDVEHYNAPVLRGAAECLRRLNPVVFIEAETDDVLEQTDFLLNEYGYVCVPGLVLNATPTYEYRKG